MAAVWGVVACGSPELPPVTDDAPADWVDPSTGSSEDVRARVLSTRWVRQDDGSLDAHIDLVLSLARAPVWDGLRAWHRREILKAESVMAIVDGDEIAPRVMDREGFFGTRLDVPAEGDRRVRGILVVPTGADHPPETLALKFSPATGSFEVPIRPAQTVQPRPTIDNPELAGLATLVEPGSMEPWTLSGVMEGLSTLEDVERAVQSLAVLPTTGIQRGPRAVWTRQGGSPLERAELARQMLQMLGHRGELVCGDLTTDQIESIFQGALSTDADDPLASTWTQAATQMESLVPALSSFLEESGDAADGRRARIPLVPEWCWVRVGGEGEQIQLDLRPDGARDTPLPPVWRVTSDTSTDQWRLQVRFHARRLVGRNGEEEVYESVSLIDHQVPASVLSDRALVFDLYPDALHEGPARLRSQLTVMGDDEAGGRIGAHVTRDKLDAVWVDLYWSDPRGVEAGRDSAMLFSRDRDPVLPERLRVVMSGDTGAVDGHAVTLRLREAYHHQHLDPSVAAVLARHDLFSALRRRLSETERAEPSVLTSSFAWMPDGSVRQRFVDESPSPPAFVERDADHVEQIARSSAADAVARSLITGKAVEPPARWFEGEGFVQSLSNAGRFDQWQLRELRGELDETHRFGVDADRTLDSFWSWQATTGELQDMGLSRETSPWPTPLAVPEDAAPNEPIWVHRHWLRPILCHEAPTWSDLLDVSTTPCSPRTPQPE